MTSSLLRAGMLAGTMIAGLLLTHPATARTERLSVIAGGEKVGFVEAEIDGNRIAIRHDVKNNGRGPTMAERLVLDRATGLPVEWALDGTSTFGSPVAERFTRDGAKAAWTDSMGDGTADAGQQLYVGQYASPWALGLYARALLKDKDRRIPVLPAGELSLESLGKVTAGEGKQALKLDAYLIKGIDLEPAIILLDKDGSLFAEISANGVVVREGHEAAADSLRHAAEKIEADRYVALQQRLARRFDQPVRIRNVRVFQPETGTLSDPVSVVTFRNRISAVEPLDSPATPGEVLVEGGGGTLMPGLHDMHAHVSLQSALLYIAAGVTSVRDMGNSNDVLLGLTDQIEVGKVAGPRIVRNGFVEGRSPFSARNGIVMDSEAAALDAVRWYAARGYWQIKVYNSMNPAWVPALSAEARRLGLGVTGHIPAFTNADAMIDAGYGEVTHINQVMLGWVLKPDEDTRTPLRLTAMTRTGDLDLKGPAVRKTLKAMVDKGIAHDPTAVTLELLMLSRNRVPCPCVADYIDHLPIGLQRRRMNAIAPIKGPEEDAAYQAGFAKVLEVLKLFHDNGIRLLPGTDDHTGLSLHRELELYAKAGIPVADVLRMGTLGPEQYMKRDQILGSIAKDKLADFFLIDGNPLENLGAIRRIRMVVKDGAVYYPAEILEALGIRPFATPPTVTLPDTPARRADALPVGPHDHSHEYGVQTAY
ncbi:amidohydrolase family protein [Niveispirillum sp. KHB5.9]|uniref:amidohydrolase family protein n=1 Tax=Niveispirillum sp. KHB5.9 TaxID=3400269 RepID=UPI003A87A22B